MSTSPVPLIPPTIPVDNIKTGVAPSASTWTKMALLANHCHGRGGTLIPAYRPGNTIASGSNGTYNYFVQGSHYAVAQYWVVRAHSVSSTVDATVTLSAPAGGGTPRTYRVGSDMKATEPMFCVDPTFLGVPADDLSLNIATADAGIIVDQIACYEIPRTVLGPTEGVDVDSLRGNSPIFEQEAVGARDSVSIHGAAEAMRFYRGVNAPLFLPNRMLWCWSVPTADALTTTSNVVQKATHQPVPFICKRTYRKERSPSADVRVYAYAKVDANMGHVSYRYGDNENVSTAPWFNMQVTGTSYAWYTDLPMTTAGAIEDLDRADGRYYDTGAAVLKWSEFEIGFRRWTSANIHVAAVCVWDEGG